MIKYDNWTCDGCGKINHPEVKFCEFCGKTRVVKERSAAIEKIISPTVKTARKPSAACPSCGALNDADMVYCCSCGALLGKGDSTPLYEELPIEKPASKGEYCAQCGTLNDGSSAFCIECGAKLGEAVESYTPPPRIERKEEYVKPAVAEKSGALYNVKCPECGELNTADDLFCMKCGSPMKKERKIEPTPLKMSEDIIISSEKKTVVKRDNPFMHKPSGISR